MKKDHTLLSGRVDDNYHTLLSGRVDDNYHNLLPRILGWIRQASWLVVSDILDAKILEYLEQGLAYVRESYGTVVWIALLNQDVAIEAAHLIDGEDTDTTE